MTTAQNTAQHPPKFLVPWPCLLSDDVPPTKPIFKPPTTNLQQKTFAQALSNVCDIPLNQLPQPCMKGDQRAIEIPEDEYLAGIEECKFSLQGRIIWPKGSTPVSIEVLCSKLSVLWKSLRKWGITSIGR
jgi:hypothetical protein